MSKEQYIVGLDIGTQNIRVVQAKIDAEGQTSVVAANCKLAT
jgi:cell division ATPase FtsA